MRGKSESLETTLQVRVNLITGEWSFKTPAGPYAASIDAMRKKWARQRKRAKKPR